MKKGEDAAVLPVQLPFDEDETLVLIIVHLATVYGSVGTLEGITVRKSAGSHQCMSAPWLNLYW